MVSLLCDPHKLSTVALQRGSQSPKSEVPQVAQLMSRRDAFLNLPSEAFQAFSLCGAGLQRRESPGYETHVPIALRCSRLLFSLSHSKVHIFYHVICLPRNWFGSVLEDGSRGWEE